MTPTHEFTTPAEAWERTLTEIATTPLQIAMVITGGGTGAISRCFGRSGASVNFLEAVVPYCRSSTDQYLGCKPVESYSSLMTSKALAQVAYRRAESHSGSSRESVGISLTATLPTDTTIRDVTGDQSAYHKTETTPGFRIYVSSCRTRIRKTWSLCFPDDPYGRDAAESIADQMLLLAFHDTLEQHGLGRGSDPFGPLREAGLDVTSITN